MIEKTPIYTLKDSLIAFTDNAFNEAAEADACPREEFEAEMSNALNSMAARYAASCCFGEDHTESLGVALPEAVDNFIREFIAQYSQESDDDGAEVSFFVAVDSGTASEPVLQGIVRGYDG